MILVTGLGQIKDDEALVIKTSIGSWFIVHAKSVKDCGGGEEVILSKGKNIYFNVDLYLKGKSWVTQVYRLPGVKLTAICNNMNAFPVY